MKNTEHKEKVEISLKSANLVIMLLITVFCILIALNTVQISKYNGESLKLSEEHIKYTDIAMQLNLGSDILTEQVRLFAETGAREYMDSYFEESKVSRHRDKAMETLEELPWVNTEEKVKSAMRESNLLMEREYYAMRLTAFGFGIPFDTLPEEIKSVVIAPEDVLLSEEEAREKARRILFDDTYLSAKHRIKTDINSFLDDMIDISLYEYNNITKRLEKNMILQSVIILAMLIIILGITGFMNRCVVRPMIRASRSIKNNEPIDMPPGIEEMRALSDSYNSLREHNNELVSQLGVMASRDALTCLGNRFAYNSYITEVSGKNKQLIMFLFDVNNLRKTNNNEGHAIGDKLLSDAGQCIKTVFGIYEYENCFRVGGDEFVAFIENEPRKRANVYIESFKEETEKRGISVSVGYSYSDDISKTSADIMFSDADANMYKAKYGENSHE